jgi:hypothetical protein
VTKIKLLFVGLSALISSLGVGSAHAEINQTWVSSTGTGTTCTRALPCRFFADAHTATAAGTISKSLTVRAVGVDGGSASSGIGGIYVTVNAGPSDVVILEGLRFNFGAVVFNSGGHLQLVGCVVAMNTASGSSGISFVPNTASKLSVTDSVMSNNGSGTGAGILIKPVTGGSARVNLERVTVNGNAFGIAVDGSGSTAGINMTIADSMIGGNVQDGIIATTSSGHAAIGVMVTNTKSVNNAFGIRSIGPNVTVRVKNSDIVGNVTGLSFSGGGALQSYGNNSVDANGTNGAFSGPIPLK